VRQAPNRLEAAWLTEAPLRDLLAALDRAGEEARVVGGAVRNTLVGDPPGDIDIATTALPREVIRRVEAAGFKAVPTGNAGMHQNVPREDIVIARAEETGPAA